MGLWTRRTAAWMVVALLAGGLAADEAPPFRVVFREGDALKVRVELEKKKKKLESAKSLVGKTLTGKVAEDYYYQGCLVIAAESEATLEIVDASAPLKKGKPGFFDVRLVKVALADESEKEIEGGLLRLDGVDMTDKGKKLLVLPRKGGKVALKNGQVLELEFLNAPPPPEGGAGEDAKPPKPMVIYVDGSVC